MNKKNITDIIKDLIEVNRRLSYNLWNVSFFGEKPSGLSPRLIFPKKREKNKKDEDIKRISEQEARILYCNILNNLNYFYSIETPTDYAYIQSGKTGVSALSDLSIYRCTDKGFKKKANVEFKALNPTTEDINKDIEKIIKEGLDGNWFSKISILFCMCVLEKKFSIIKYFDYDPSFGENVPNLMKEFFCLSKISDSNNIKDKNMLKQKDILKNNGWTIFES